MRTPEEEFQHLLSTPAYKTWYDSRPRKVQELIKKYPFTWYKVSEGAPYGISGPGTVVELISYAESGEISVAVHPHNLTEAGKEHIRMLCNKHGKMTYEQATAQGHRVYINPAFLEPYDVSKFHKQ